MKTTIKSYQTLNKLSNPNAILIPSYTGEYLDASTNYGSIDEPNRKFIKSEPWLNFQGDAYQLIRNALASQGWDSIAYIPTSEIQSYFDKLCQIFKETITWSIDQNYIGDDTFYDYLPDLYNMLQYAAYGLILKTQLITEKDLDTIFESLLKPIDDLIKQLDDDFIEIKQFDNAFTEKDETLKDQCSRLSLTSFLTLNINII